MDSSRSHIPSLLSALLYIVAAMLFSSVALIMAVTSLGTFFAGKEVGAQQTILVTVSTFEAMLILGAAFVAIQRFGNKAPAEREMSFNISASQIAIGLIVTALSLLAGYQLVKTETAMWLLLPFLTLPVVVLPLLMLLGLAIRNIPLGTRWQSWNIFGIGMTLGPFVLIFLEAIALILIVVIAVAILLTQPGFEAQIQFLSQKMYMLDPQSSDAQKLIAPYLFKPGVIVVAIGYFAVIVPTLEELFKPLGVWFFANKLTSPAQGFALGALSGTAYALVETLGVSAQAADWAGLLISRMGTGALHVTTSALMGAGIVYAVRERRYWRLLGIYVLSVALHGLWNALAIFFVFSNLANYFEFDSPYRQIGTPLNIAMVILAGFFLVILVLSNRRIKATIQKPIGEEITNP